MYVGEIHRQHDSMPVNERTVARSFQSMHIHNHIHLTVLTVTDTEMEYVRIFSTDQCISYTRDEIYQITDQWPYIQLIIYSVLYRVSVGRQSVPNNRPIPINTKKLTLLSNLFI